MDPDVALAAYDEQIRKNPPEAIDAVVERDDQVVRMLVADGWAGVTWSGLEAAEADDVIAAQIARFSRRDGPWEWKHYSYDQPPELADRLIAAGFSPEPAETLMVAEIADLSIDFAAPGIELRDVADSTDVAALVALHDEVFGGDHSAVGRSLLDAMASTSPTTIAVLAAAESTIVSAGRVELHPGTEFASLWGGGTLPGWRGRGAFRSLVARRAALALQHGYRYLQVDASADSRPILRRLGFVELATTTPFIHPGGGHLDASRQQPPG